LFFSANTTTLAPKIKEKMRQFNFIPPSGSVYVAFRDEAEFKENGARIATRDTSRARLMSAPVTAIPPNGTFPVGDKAIFHRSAAHEVSEGVFFLHEESIHGFVGEGGIKC
jgi:hypothetical protein